MGVSFGRLAKKCCCRRIRNASRSGTNHNYRLVCHEFYSASSKKVSFKEKLHGMPILIKTVKVVEKAMAMAAMAAI
jgi:hypothetical protein